MWSSKPTQRVAARTAAQACTRQNTRSDNGDSWKTHVVRFSGARGYLDHDVTTSKEILAVLPPRPRRARDTHLLTDLAKGYLRNHIPAYRSYPLPLHSYTLQVEHTARTRRARTSYHRSTLGKTNVAFELHKHTTTQASFGAYTHDRRNARKFCRSLHRYVGAAALVVTTVHVLCWDIPRVPLH